MTNIFETHHRVVGPVVMGWLALQIGLFGGSAFGRFGTFVLLAVPIAIGFGFTERAKALIPRAVVLSVGLMGAQLAAAVGGILGFAAGVTVPLFVAALVAAVVVTMRVPLPARVGDA